MIPIPLPDILRNALDNDAEAVETARRPVMPDQLTDPIGWLIYRLTFLTEEQLQDGPVSMVTRAAAIAQLYQAKSLTEIAEQLSAIDENLTGLRALARDLDQKFNPWNTSQNLNQPL